MSQQKSFTSPFQDRVWAYIPEGIRKTLSSEPIIPVIATKAKILAAKKPDFIRSDQGQVIGIFPEKEVYDEPPSVSWSDSRRIGESMISPLLKKRWKWKNSAPFPPRFSALPTAFASVMPGCPKRPSKGYLIICRMSWIIFRNK